MEEKHSTGSLTDDYELTQQDMEPIEEKHQTTSFTETKKHF